MMEICLVRYNEPEKCKIQELKIQKDLWERTIDVG